MGAVLLQDGKPVEYYSELFTGSIRNYPTYDKEFFALYQAIKHWRVYLLGKEVVVHSVINAEYLKLFEPPLLDDDGDDKVVLPPVDDLWFDREEPLKEDCILEQKVTKTRQGERAVFRIGRAGQVPSQSKWFSKEKGTLEFPHLQF
ncbi:hypothetical protein ACLB2K_057167 [Fragaria x ananassa]